jgi:hypothetical protein
MVRKAGLEPACLSAPPPQDGVSANSTTSARLPRAENRTLARLRPAHHVNVILSGEVLQRNGCRNAAPDKNELPPYSRRFVNTLTARSERMALRDMEGVGDGTS